MKNKILIPALAAMFSAAAHAGDFDGLSIGFGINAIGAETHVSDSSGSATIGQTSVNSSIFAQYGMMATDTTVVNVGVSYDFGDIKSGDGAANGISYAVKGSDHYSIYFEPGLILNPGTELYGKLGYHSIKGEISGTDLSSHTFSGVGVSVGLRSKLDKQLFMQVELEHVDYAGDTIAGTTYKPKTNAGKVALGYRF